MEYLFLLFSLVTTHNLIRIKSKLLKKKLQILIIKKKFEN
jgi:hypothetical protein